MFVASVNRPGGNVTGATFIGTSITAKRLQILRELLPRYGHGGASCKSQVDLAEPQIKDAEAAAGALGLGFAS